ncbi:hypothetical protein ACTBWJ_003422 [Shigella flexneri]
MFQRNIVDFSRIAGGWESPEWVIFELPALVRFVLPDAPPGAAYPEGAGICRPDKTRKRRIRQSASLPDAA